MHARDLARRLAAVPASAALALRVTLRERAARAGALPALWVTPWSIPFCAGERTNRHAPLTSFATLRRAAVQWVTASARLAHALRSMRPYAPAMATPTKTSVLPGRTASPSITRGRVNPQSDRFRVEIWSVRAARFAWTRANGTRARGATIVGICPLSAHKPACVPAFRSPPVPVLPVVMPTGRFALPVIELRRAPVWIPRQFTAKKGRGVARARWARAVDSAPFPGFCRD
jgi:hypothetical protein